MEKNYFNILPLKIFIFAFFSFFLIKNTIAHPTIESLFRNGGNPDVNDSSNLVQVSLKVGKVEDGNLAIDFNKLSDVMGLKFNFYLDHEKIYFDQYLFSNLTFSTDSIISFFQADSWYKKMMKNEEIDYLKGFFYSIMSVLVLNKEDLFIKYLKQVSPNFQDNKSLIDVEKKDFYRRHEISLLDSKKWGNREGENESMESDRQGSTLKMTNKDLNRPFFVDSKQVIPVKIDNEIFLKASADNFNALFSNSEHRLLNVGVLANHTDYEIILRDYLIFNGIHLLPKYIVLKINSEVKFVIEFLELRHRTMSEKYFKKNVKDIIANEDEAKKLNYALHTLPFLY